MTVDSRSLIVKMNRGQGIFNDKVIDSLKKLLLFAENYFLLIGILSVMVHQIVAQFMELNMGLYSYLNIFYSIISVLYTCFCLLLLFELLISLGVDALMFSRGISNILKASKGHMPTLVGIRLGTQWLNWFRIVDQLFYWWISKFVCTLVALVFADNGVAVQWFTLPKQVSYIYRCSM